MDFSGITDYGEDFVEQVLSFYDGVVDDNFYNRISFYYKRVDFYWIGCPTEKAKNEFFEKIENIFGENFVDEKEFLNKTSKVK